MVEHTKEVKNGASMEVEQGKSGRQNVKLLFTLSKVKVDDAYPSHSWYDPTRDRNVT